MAKNPDLEASVTPRIAEAIEAAVGKLGRNEFIKLAGIDNELLQEISKPENLYVSVGLVTLACEVNKAHGDPDLNHSSVTECLKGSTIRIPSVRTTQPIVAPNPDVRRRFQRKQSSPKTSGPLLDKSSSRLLGFAANTISFLILGYFLGGIALAPLLGEASCIGVSASPPSLSPCGGSLLGLVISAIGGLGYTYYYFVKKL